VLLGGWGALAYGLVAAVILLGSHDIDQRDVILEASGLIWLWVILGGWVIKRYHAAMAAWLQRIRLPWGLRFVLLCTLMAMLEEAVTTGMSNLAVHFGGASPAGMITASTNYFQVIAYHSVVVFIPMYVVWALLLWRWRFTPIEVMLLYGLTGTLAETLTFGAQNLGAVGMWTFVYGLMVFLPACTVPLDRRARPVRWWHWPLAVALPFFGGVLFVPLVLLWRGVAGLAR
jgi:hypothetical protein